MLNAINRFGLSRRIPADVTRHVRQNSGFGCVICGLGIYEYEHVHPLWVDAEVHDPENITLLCSQCHSKKTRGMLSVSSIRKAMENPKSKQAGYSNEYFDFDGTPPFIHFGGNRMEEIKIPIMVKGEALFTIEPPEEPGTSFLLSGQFYDSNGSKSLFIINNEWKAFNSNWDVDVKGPTITIRERVSKICLILRSVPPHGIIVERLQMYYQGWDLRGTKNTLEINGNVFSGNLMKSGHVGISLG